MSDTLRGTTLAFYGNELREREAMPVHRTPRCMENRAPHRLVNLRELAVGFAAAMDRAGSKGHATAELPPEGLHECMDCGLRTDEPRPTTIEPETAPEVPTCPKHPDVELGELFECVVCEGEILDRDDDLRRALHEEAESYA